MKKPTRVRSVSPGEPSGNADGGNFRTGTVYSTGRPPWYNIAGEKHTAYIIGIAGGTASGKTTVARKIIEGLGVRWVSLLSQDSFYRVLTPEQITQANNSDFDFDHPDSIDMELMVDTLRRLKKEEQVDIPIYDFSKHCRSDEKVSMYGASVIIVEGLFVLQHPALRELLDLKIFVVEDADVRLARRLKRDINERGRDIQGVLKQYNRFVKPSFDTHIEPTKTHADLVIPRGGDNTVAMHLLINEVKAQLKERALGVRQLLARRNESTDVPPNLHVVATTNQLRSYTTKVCSASTSRSEFVFYSERMMRLLLEFVVSKLPYVQQDVSFNDSGAYITTTPARRTVGVSVLRSGLAMESTLSKVVEGIKLGRILITTNVETMEPELHYCSLPDLEGCNIILQDPTMATGAAAMMAVRVLLDHGASQENIYIATLLTSLTGVHSLNHAFPQVTVMCCSHAHSLDHNLHLVPGVGNFGDRYFGTDQKSNVSALDVTAESKEDDC
eukprot:m.74408 g.74408  ORF g.74408 m.74408 type:complete len:500 (-) comp24658_c0_seq2:127-1626(-)